jgi:hypothetical protein
MLVLILVVVVGSVVAELSLSGFTSSRPSLSRLLDGSRCRKLGLGSGRRIVGRMVTGKVLGISRRRRCRIVKEANEPRSSYLQVSKKQQNRPCNNLQAIPSRAWTSRNWARCSREIAFPYRSPFLADPRPSEASQPCNCSTSPPATQRLPFVASRQSLPCNGTSVAAC